MKDILIATEHDIPELLKVQKTACESSLSAQGITKQ